MPSRKSLNERTEIETFILLSFSSVFLSRLTFYLVDFCPEYAVFPLKRHASARVPSYAILSIAGPVSTLSSVPNSLHPH